MSYERGGYADKLGNRFEDRWVVRQMLQVLAGRTRAITLEAVGADEPGVDLWIEHNDGTREAQQCKGENGTKSDWSMADLHARGVLGYLRDQLLRDPSWRFTFISGIPATMLRDLSRGARDSNGNPQVFYQYQVLARSDDHRTAFQGFCRHLELAPADPGQLAQAYDLLRRTDSHLFSDSSEERAGSEMLASSLVAGDPGAILATLRDCAHNNLRKTLHADQIRSELAKHGFLLRDLANDQRLAPQVEVLQQRFIDSIRSGLAAARLIPRVETQQILQYLDRPGGAKGIILLEGDAGLGKSGVLYELVRVLVSRGMPYLPLRLDRQLPLGSAEQYGKSRGLPGSPVLCLDAFAGSRESVLILDQLDALRWTSARAGDSLEVCQEIVRQALHLQRQDRRMFVVMSCRTFDLEHDPQIRSWLKDYTNDPGDLTGRPYVQRVKVQLLPEEVVRQFAEQVGGAYGQMLPQERSLLRSVQNLAMWAELQASKGAPRFVTATQLMRAFWQDRRRRLEERGVDADEQAAVLDAIVRHMDREGEISAPARLIDGYQRAAGELKSLNAIQEQESRVSFCHQSYLDYLVADRLLRQIDEGAGSVAEWLGPPDRQSLFRREQLRQVLNLLLDDDPDRFLKTARDLVATDSIRFHLKHLVLEVLGHMEAPSEPILNYVADLLASPKWRPHAVDTVVMSHVTFVADLARRGVLQAWLSG